LAAISVTEAISLQLLLKIFFDFHDYSSANQINHKYTYRRHLAALEGRQSVHTTAGSLADRSAPTR
jgi:hypothetical protein